MQFICSSLRFYSLHKTAGLSFLFSTEIMTYFPTVSRSSCVFHVSPAEQADFINIQLRRFIHIKTEPYPTFFKI